MLRLSVIFFSTSVIILYLSRVASSSAEPIAIIGPLAVVFLLCMCALVFTRTDDLLEPSRIVALQGLVLFVLIPLYQMATGLYPIRLEMDWLASPQLFAKVELLAILGLVCFYLGYFNHLGSRIGSKLPVFIKGLNKVRMTKIF